MTQKIDNNSYKGNQLLKSTSAAVSFTPKQIKEMIKCKNDPIHFIEQYVKIIDVDDGLVSFQLRGFQKDMVKAYMTDRFIIGKIARQSGKSICVVAIILHYILFNSEKSVALLANKMNTAKDLLGRLQRSYENLPSWMQQGVVSWNKSSLELENGSKVLAASTSSSAVRGGSFSMLFLDEFAFIPFNIAEEFFRSVYPTISSGQETKVIIISTPMGMNMFYKMWTDAVNGRNSYKTIECHWADIPGRDDKWKKETIENMPGGQKDFDAEFECHFQGSSLTLISGQKLRTMAFIDPLWVNQEGLEIYEKPKPDHIYTCVVDTSRGAGVDYSAFLIIDMTEMPYHVVAKYRNNDITPLLYPSIVYRLCMEYNEAWLLVEINDVGAQVADIIYQELEYTNLLMVTQRGRKGQTVDGGFGKGQTRYGVLTSSAVKKIGCAVLKSLIEEDKLIIQDQDIIFELCTFVARKDSFEAEPGQHDDLAICLVLFAWLTTQNYYKDLTDINVRTKLYKDKIKEIEEEMLPFGFGTDDNVMSIDGMGEIVDVDADGDVWFST